MRMILHILRKDIRHLAWALLLWFLVLAAQSAPLLLALDRRLTDSGGLSALIYTQYILFAFQVLLQVVILAQLVQSDPLVGSTGFWMTRPVSRAQLLTSKLLFVGLLLVLPDLGLEVLIAAGNGVDWADILHSLPLVLGWQLFIVLPLMAFAALTPNLPRFVLPF